MVVASKEGGHPCNFSFQDLIIFVFESQWMFKTGAIVYKKFKLFREVGDVCLMFCFFADVHTRSRLKLPELLKVMEWLTFFPSLKLIRKDYKSNI